ncbi:PepSY domain-containing protein [Porphyromonadaceae bacterium OttesenSCG-928-L07]|nr:PepSY domain-containing protein [Porphyromonadaceae bacterium OttesenSCG-928-L07]MDL2252129.1 PepSY domain-containing protein [Odoribacter sp. OttesenSCG-928-J03]
MKKVKAFLFSLHRIFGSIVCLFFFMWFVSGLVLVYHSFPKVTKEQKYEKMEALPSSLPHWETVLSPVCDSVDQVQSLKVRQFQNQTLYTVKTKDSTYVICNDSLQAVTPVTFQTIRQIARKWVDSPVVRVDTLYERDQWILYSWYVNELPVYKFYYDDDEKHQLYVSSRTAEVLQLSTRKERFWAWMGAIPHKFYIPLIRRDTNLWTRSLTIAGFIALIAALSGVSLGIYVLRKSYKNKKRLVTPYRKRWYKWHHVTGLVFGVFLITWAFSGAISMQRLPQWLVKTYGEYRISPAKIRGKRLSLDKYVLDYRSVQQVYSDVKEIEWSHYRDVPVYNIVTGNKELCIDASTDQVKKLYLPENQIEKSIRAVHGKDASFTIHTINEYEEYYLARKNKLPLPVYKVEVDNEDASRYYIDPATGDFKYLNRSRKVKKWLFNAMHYLQIKWLYEKPVLWVMSMWVLCIGGALVSLTGIVLSVRYIRRKLKR